MLVAEPHAKAVANPGVATWQVQLQAQRRLGRQRVAWRLPARVCGRGEAVGDSLAHNLTRFTANCPLTRLPTAKHAPVGGER